VFGAKTRTVEHGETDCREHAHVMVSYINISYGYTSYINQSNTKNASILNTIYQV